MGNLFLTVICAVLLQINVCGELLYPWGSDNGDSQGPTAGGFYPIQMNNRMRFLRKSYYNISLCAGGRIGFEPFNASNYNQAPWYYVYPGPFDCGDVNILPFGVKQNLGVNSEWGSIFGYLFTAEDFWGDNYHSIFSEKLWYRTTNNTDLLARAMTDIHDKFPDCYNGFKPKELFIATWTDVHDIDFCDRMGYNKEMCDCMMNAPFLNYYPIDYMRYNNPNDWYCRCLVEEEDPRACFCYAQLNFLHTLHVSLYDYVNSSLCKCLLDNDYDLDFCDCEVYGNCGMSKRSAVKRETQEVNTYQAVIMTDGRKQTFAMFNYESINWVYMNTDLFQTHKPEHYGDPVRIYAKIGFEENNEKGYYHQYSGSDDLYKLVNDSNVGVPGRWMYRIDGRKIQTPDCERHPLR